MKKVRDILKVKGHDVRSVAPDASVYDAVKLMADKGIGALLVIEGGKTDGHLSQSEITRGRSFSKAVRRKLPRYKRS